MYLGALSGGCFAFANPPAHLRIGAGSTTSEIKQKNYDGTIYKTNGIAEIAVGLDSTGIAELPFSIEPGLIGDFDHGGTYLEGGYLRRLLPWLRVGATGGGEYWWGDNHGFGARAGLTLEYVRPFRRRADVDVRGTDSHDKSTEYMAQTGTPGVGAFLDAGYRSLSEQKYGYIVVGLSVRVPAAAFFIDLTEQH
jgi:hypothetical protein